MLCKVIFGKILLQAGNLCVKYRKESIRFTDGFICDEGRVDNV